LNIEPWSPLAPPKAGKHRTFNVQRRMWKALLPVITSCTQCPSSFCWLAQARRAGVRRSSFICPQGVDSSLKYVESEFTPGQ